MKRTTRIFLAAILIAGSAAAQGASGPRPYIGYLCAAGGQRGTVVRITAGGQALRGASGILVSGEGVRGRAVGFRRAPWLLNNDERRAVAQRIRSLVAPRAAGRGRAAKEAVPEGLPDHPMLKDLESLTPKELRRVAYEFLDRGRRSQLSAQIAETIELELTIDANAAPGDRELRIVTPRGLTNPVLFQVGTVPEFSEAEPNDYRTLRQPTVDSPCVLNGQVSFKDIDHFRFKARKGQKLVIDVQARRLVPYLADAVPGWFQATLALYDAHGNELSFVDDHRFDPDPVLFFDVEEDGEYRLEVRDAIYRGRADFVYRITVAERPFVLSMFPLGARTGSAGTAEVDGWNLSQKRVRLDTRRGADPIRNATWSRAKLRTNPVAYAIDGLPEGRETEPNDAREQARLVPLPKIVNGIIERRGDTDWFRFAGRAGQEVVIEVYGRRLGSPLDSLVQLTDAAGCVLAWNDDHPDRNAGLVTHQADSYLRAKLLTTEQHFVRVSDAQGQGGGAFAYRLRISAPRPDFAVVIAPASINVPSGGHAVVELHAIRKDGFDGEIEIALPDAGRGLFLSATRIPAGCDRIRTTLAAPPQRRGPPLPLTVVARARVAGKPVKHTAVPAENMMQAFGLRHLVPAQELLVDIPWSWRRSMPMRLVHDRAAKIPQGGTVEVSIDGLGLPPVEMIRFELDAPPPGVTLKEVRARRGGLVLILAAERGKAQPGLADNLIVNAHVEVEQPRGRGKAQAKAKGKNKPKAATRTVTAVLPAVPFVVVE